MEWKHAINIANMGHTIYIHVLRIPGVGGELPRRNDKDTHFFKGQDDVFHSC